MTCLVYPGPLRVVETDGIDSSRHVDARPTEEAVSHPVSCWTRCQVCPFLPLLSTFGLTLYPFVICLGLLRVLLHRLGRQYCGVRKTADCHSG
jgi:hypothetical protein